MTLLAITYELKSEMELGPSVPNADSARARHIDLKLDFGRLLARSRTDFHLWYSLGGRHCRINRVPVADFARPSHEIHISCRWETGLVFNRLHVQSVGSAAQNSDVKY